MGKDWSNLGLKSCTSKDGLDDSRTIQKSNKKKKKKNIQKEESSEKKRLDHSETELNSKKVLKKKSSDKKAMRKLTKSIENLQKKAEIMLANRAISFKEEDERFECGFSVPEASGRSWGNNCQTILVKGLDSSLARDVMKSALSQHFGSCGEVVRVFVPIECETKARLGFALINLKNEEDVDKALKLNGSELGGRKLEVMMAKDKVEYTRYPYPDFKGCSICRTRQLRRRQNDLFHLTHGYRIPHQRLIPDSRQD